MATHKPLVIINGQIQQIPAGDSLNAAASEVDVVSAINANVNSITIGSPVYVPSSGNVDLASATSAATKKVLGLVRDVSVPSSASGTIQTDGILTATTAQWDAVTGGTGGLVAGAIYYLDVTAGMLTAIPPSSAGSFVCRVGVALSTTDFEIDTDRGGVLLS